MNVSDSISSFVFTFVDEVNSGKLEAALARFSENATIVEDIPPFKWEGLNAGSQWLAAMAENAKRLGMTSVVMELGDVRRVEVEADAAYVIVAGTVQLQQLTRTLREPGVLTFTLKRNTDNWLISSLTWTGRAAA